jgi:hypothetical protein
LDNSDKASNKAMSGAMKYALIELFCVPTQDVEDSDRTSPETGGPRRGANVARTTEEIPLPKPKSAAANKGEGGETSSKGHEPPEAAEPEPPKREPLPPVEELVKQAEAAMSPKPATLPEGHIEDGQAANFGRLFKDALKPALRKHADEIRHDWLKKQGIVDGNGEPTAKAILKDNFYEVREVAVQYAGGLESVGG